MRIFLLSSVFFTIATCSYHVFANDGISSFSPYYGIKLNASENRAFITSYLDNTVKRCDINTATGVISNCSDTGGGEFFGPANIVLNSAGNTAFIINAGNGTIARCDVNTENGAFSHCSSCGGTVFSQPSGMILNTEGNRVFVTNYSNGSIGRCDLNTIAGTFSHCSTILGTGLYSPYNLVLNASGSHAFITDYIANRVRRCDVNTSTGVFSNCSNTGGIFWGPTGIKLNASGNRAFVINSEINTISRCVVNTDTGTFSHCSNTRGTKFSRPIDMILSRFGNRAFVTNYRNRTISRCNVDMPTGVFSDCVNASYDINVISETAVNNESLSRSGYKITIYHEAKQQREVDIVDKSINIPDFRVVLPANDRNVQLRTTCPLIPSFFKAHTRCKIFYTILSTSHAVFNEDILLKSDGATISHLRITKDPVFFGSQNGNGTYLNKITDYALVSSPRTAGIVVSRRTGSDIKFARFSLSPTLTDAHISLSGNCIKKNPPILTTGSCRLNYTIAAATKPVSGELFVTTNRGVTKLPFSIKSLGFYLSVSRDRSKVTNKTPLNVFTFIPGHSYTVHVTHLSSESFKVDTSKLGKLKNNLNVKTSTCKLNSDNITDCDLNFNIPVKTKSNIERMLTIISKGIAYNYSVIIQKIPVSSITIANRGGYILWFKYPVYNSVDSIGFSRSPTFLLGQSHTEQLLEGQQILLHATGAAGRYICLTIDHPNGHIRCSRGMSNMVCYWDDHHGKSVWVRTVKTQQGRMACPGWLSWFNVL